MCTVSREEKLTKPPDYSIYLKNPTISCEYIIMGKQTGSTFTTRIKYGRGKIRGFGCNFKQFIDHSYICCPMRIITFCYGNQILCLPTSFGLKLNRGRCCFSQLLCLFPEFKSQYSAVGSTLTFLQDCGSDP